MALCRFRLPDEDFEELKKKCEEEKLLLSDIMREFVATFLNHNVSVRTYCGHKLDHDTDTPDIVATNSKNDSNNIVATNCEDTFDSIYCGHKLSSEENSIMADILISEGYFL